MRGFGTAKRPCRGAKPLRIAAVSVALAAAATLTHRLAFVGLGAPLQRPHGAALLQQRGHGHGATALKVSERAAYIAVVDVDVVPGEEQAFLEASLANARESTREPLNNRFDILQSQKDDQKFTLVEIYRNAQGPTDHKATPHYATWRDTVADMMATPRSATQWDTIFPGTASGYDPVALILERDNPTYFDITHVFVDVVPGSEEAFIDASLANAKESLREAACMRFDIMRNVDDPTKFMLVEAYRSIEGAREHKTTAHYEIWRDTVADIMATPRQAKKYINHYPNLPAGWQSDGGR